MNGWADYLVEAERQLYLLRNLPAEPASIGPYDQTSPQARCLLSTVAERTRPLTPTAYQGSIPNSRQHCLSITQALTSWNPWQTVPNSHVPMQYALARTHTCVFLCQFVLLWWMASFLSKTKQNFKNKTQIEFIRTKGTFSLCVSHLR